MDKITSYMRVTKKRKALEGDAKAAAAAAGVSKPHAVEKTALAPPLAATLKKHKAVESEDDGQVDDHGVHVPTFIYDTIKYQRKGGTASKVDEPTRRVLAYIQDHFAVPQDLETNHKYGPHSGATYESRLLRAYKLKLLEPTTKKAVAPICLTCAAVGHTDRECPDGF